MLRGRADRSASQRRLVGLFIRLRRVHSQLLRSEGRETYHPAITSTTAIHEPSGDLASGLNDQQAAEALGELKDGGGPSQQTVPITQSDCFHQAIATEDPFVNRAILRAFSSKGALDPTAVIIRVHGEAVQGPDQQDGNEDPLGRANDDDQRRANP